jgi:predicted acylesterase/phospholipase RssA
MTPEQRFGKNLAAGARLLTKPDGFEAVPGHPETKVVLCLQGGGARAAYQVGVYEAMEKLDFLPDWVIGVSSGALNGAVIAGNPPGKRLEKLQRLWRLFRSPWDLPSIGKQGPRVKRMSRQLDALLSVFGKPNFYWPRLDNPLVNPLADSFYQQDPLRRTMSQLVDFRYLAEDKEATRLSIGCVDVETGTLRFFDSRRDIAMGAAVPPAALGENQVEQVIEKKGHRRPFTGSEPTVLGPEHLLAAAAYPPGAPAVRIGGRCYWDGGVLANSPFEALVADATREPQKRLLVILVDLWSRDSLVPRDAMAAAWRRMELEHTSHIAADIDRFLLRSPPGGQIEVIHLTYESPEADPTDPTDFSSSGIDERRKQGFADMSAALGKWLEKPLLDLTDGQEAAGSGPVYCVHRFERGQEGQTSWNFPEPPPPTS